jgi:hypothetical protein
MRAAMQCAACCCLSYLQDARGQEDIGRARHRVVHDLLDRVQDGPGHSECDGGQYDPGLPRGVGRRQRPQHPACVESLAAPGRRDAAEHQQRHQHHVTRRPHHDRRRGGGGPPTAVSVNRVRSAAVGVPPRGSLGLVYGRLSVRGWLASAAARGLGHSGTDHQQDDIGQTKWTGEARQAASARMAARDAHGEVASEGPLSKRLTERPETTQPSAVWLSSRHRSRVSESSQVAILRQGMHAMRIQKLHGKRTSVDSPKSRLNFIKLTLLKQSS